MGKIVQQFNAQFFWGGFARHDLYTWKDFCLYLGFILWFITFTFIFLVVIEQQQQHGNGNGNNLD